MRIITAICALLSAIVPAAALNPFPSTYSSAPNLFHRSLTDETVMARSISSAYDLLIPGGKAGWFPTTILNQTYDPATGVWSSGASTIIAYDNLHRLKSVTNTMPVSTGGYSYTIYLGYDTEKSVLPDTITRNSFGSNDSQLHIIYDNVVTDFPVRIEERTSRAAGGWSSWRVAFDVDIERDSRGRVTSVTPKVLDVDDLPLDIDKLVIDYATSDYPVSIICYEADDNGNGSVTFDDAVSITNMRFESCDNQILLLSDLYTSPNRLLSCDYSDNDGTSLVMTLTYGERGSYKATLKGTEDRQQLSVTMSMDYTDDNGSSVSYTRIDYPATGEYEEQTETRMLDKFGLLLEYKDSEFDSDDSYVELDTWIKGDVTYAASTTKMPIMYVRNRNVYNSDTFVPSTRQLFDGYDPASIDTITTDIPVHLRKGIFTIEGKAIPENNVLSPGLYIINGVKTLVK